MRNNPKSAILDLPDEIWKDVSGYEGKYTVSNLGRVKSLNRQTLRRGKFVPVPERILKPSSLKGYLGVILCNQTEKSFRVHRIVAITFIPNPHNLPEINHIDGVKGNNMVENLEWCTPHNNMVHAYRKLGRIPIHGETHNKAKLTDGQVREIRGKYIPYKYSCAKLGREYGVDSSAIHLIMTGRNWKYLK